MPKRLCFRMVFGALFGDFSRFLHFLALFRTFRTFGSKKEAQNVTSIRGFGVIDYVIEKVRKSALFAPHGPWAASPLPGRWRGPGGGQGGVGAALRRPASEPAGYTAGGLFHI